MSFAPQSLTELPEWIEDCSKYRGRVLMGKFSHWCIDWDYLPIDETVPEWPCGCFPRMKVE